jgi:hypothetical protein
MRQGKGSCIWTWSLGTIIPSEDHGSGSVQMPSLLDRLLHDLFLMKYEKYA